jgi:hypothetical protein
MLHSDGTLMSNGTCFRDQGPVQEGRRNTYRHTFEFVLDKNVVSGLAACRFYENHINNITSRNQPFGNPGKACASARASDKRQFPDLRPGFQLLRDFWPGF